METGYTSGGIISQGCLSKLHISHIHFVVESASGCGCGCGPTISWKHENNVSNIGARNSSWYKVKKKRRIVGGGGATYGENIYTDKCVKSWPNWNVSRRPRIRCEPKHFVRITNVRKACCFLLTRNTKTRGHHFKACNPKRSTFLYSVYSVEYWTEDI